MQKRSALGKGLAALLEDDSFETSSESSSVTTLRISFIEPKQNQPRRNFNKESLSELATSISQHGVIQPIVVRKLPSGYYQIIAGERRWRAAKMAGLNEIPAVIRDVDELISAEIAMIENLQRENLNPVEEALGYKYLAEQFSLTQDEISKKVSKSRSVIANSLRLLSLPPSILAMLEENKLSSGHARAILSVQSPEQQIRLAEKVIKNDLSVRDTEQLAKIKDEADLVDPFVPAFDYDSEERHFLALQNRITGILGTPISICRSKKPGSQDGKLEIPYKTKEQLEGIIRLLCGEEAFD